MPFNLTEQRFVWQTSTAKQAELHCADNPKKAHIDREKTCKTYTIIPNKLPLYERKISLKVDPNLINKDTRGVIFDDRRNFNKKKRNSCEPSIRYKKIVGGVKDFLKTTPTEKFPGYTLGKKQYKVDIKEKEFTPSYKQFQNNSLVSSFTGGGFAPKTPNNNNNNTNNNGNETGFKKLKKSSSQINISVNENNDKGMFQSRYTKFNNMKNQSSYNVNNSTTNKKFVDEKRDAELLYHNPSKYHQRTNSVSNVNKKSDDHPHIQRKNEEIFKSNFELGFKKNGDKNYKPKNEGVKIINKKINSSVIDFRFKSNFDLGNKKKH
jgi:hypothetical protein